MTNTTNTTKKTNGKIKRTFTAILAAVMMMSTAATIAASADNTQAVVNMNTSSAMASSGNSFAVVELDDDLLKVKDITSGTLFKVLEECTEYGKFFTPALSGILDMFIGGQPDPTQEKLDQINDKIDKLFDRIDKLQNDLVSTMETDMGIQSFHEVYTAFKAQTKAMRRKISEISTDTSLTQLDKIAKIGSLAGAYSEWDIKFENVLGQLNELFENPSATANTNIFELTYRHFCGQVMFSGEALDKAKPLCDALMQTYIAGCATLTECLSAQLYISQLPKEYQDKVDPAYKSHISLNKNDIEKEIKNIGDFMNGKVDTKTHSVFVGYVDESGNFYPPQTKVNEVTIFGYIKVLYINGTQVWKKMEEVPYEQTVNVKSMYDKTFNRASNILINKNPKGEGYQLSNKLFSCDHTSNPNCDGKYWNNMSELTQDWFKEKKSTQVIKYDDVKAMAAYCQSKGITIRSLLNSVGINTSAVPQNANLVTSDAIDGSNGDADRIIREVYYEKTFYKGVNIDQVGATEQQYQLLDCGWNLWKGGEQWNYAPGGAFCWI